MWLQVYDLFAIPGSVVNLRARAITNIASDIDDIDGIRHVYLALVHVIQHFLRPFRPDFLISGMAEKAYADDNVAFQGETFLSLKELVIEACATAEGYDFELSDHQLIIYRLNAEA